MPKVGKETLPHWSWLKPVLVLVGSAFPTEVLIALGGVQCGAQLLLPQGLHTPDLISEKQHVMVLFGHSRW